MSYKERRTWILQNVFQVEPKRRCKVKPTDDVSSGELKRKCVRNYTLQHVPVCKKMFMNTLGYSADKFLTVALSSSVNEDRQGFHDYSYHTISEQSDLLMREHVNTFEPSISHYRREHAPRRLYVDPSPSICDMYESYKKHCAEKEEKTLSLGSYSRKIKSMNISFAKLGHEECEICIKHEGHKCTATESQNVLCECCHRQEEHQKKKDEARDSYREDRSASEVNINKENCILFSRSTEG